MGETPDEPPEAQRFDDFVEIAVDGRPLFRIEQISELQLSDVDDAAIAIFLDQMVKDINDRLQEEHDKGFEEILEDEKPDVMASNSRSVGWDKAVED